MTKPYFICAIGDIHGQYEQLKELHELIFERRSIDYPNHDFILVHVGDYIDRGPNSFEVIEEMIRLEQNADFEIINLRGNHEQQFVDVYNLETEYAHLRDTWLCWGGSETVRSYEAAGKRIPYQRHVDWIHSLPLVWKHLPSKTIFVHGGIDPKTYPDIDPDVVLWTRSAKFMNVADWNNPALDGWTVVHGHTPTRSKQYEFVTTEHNSRINIDTGAVYAGSLTAVLLCEDKSPEFISVISNDPPWERP